MAPVRRLLSGVRALLLRAREERELEEELQHYVEAAAEQKVQSGFSPDQALRLAKAELGSAEAVKDYTRDAGWERLLENLYRDLHYGARMLRRNPGFSAVVILTLALGIGANTAIFSLVNAVLLNDLPVKNPDQLVLFSFHAPANRPYMTDYDGTAHSTDSDELTGTSFPYLVFQRFAEDHDTLSNIFAFARIEQLNVAANGDAQVASGQYVSGGYYAGLGVQAWRGRVLTEADDRAGAPPAAVITWHLWQRRFAGDPRVIGMAVTINNVPFTIVGVTPPGFIGAGQVGEAADVSIPLGTELLVDAADPAVQVEIGGRLREPAHWWLLMMGRLKPGVTREQVRGSMQGTFQHGALDALDAAVAAGRAKPATVAPHDYPQLLVMPGGQGEMDTRDRYRKPLTMLMVVVGLVLLIACINVANLLLARSAVRRQEIAMRLALGARRARLLRQLLTESVLLSLIAGACGVLLAYWAKDIVAAWSSWTKYNAEMDASINLRVLAFTLGVSLLTGILFGLAPALRSSTARLGLALKIRSGSTAEPSRSLLGRALVTAQVAISIVLLIAAGVFIRTLHNLQSVNTGFNQDNLLLFRVKPQNNGYNAAQVEQLYGQLLGGLRVVPGVRSVALSRHPLLASSHRVNGISLIGPQPQSAGGSGEGAGWPRDDDKSAEVNVVSPSFFETMQMPIVLGRALSDHDTASSQPVAVANQTFVRKYFPDKNPIGQHFWLPRQTKEKPWEIVGVARDAKYTDLRSETWPTIYQSYVQMPSLQANFEVRFSGRESALVPAVREAIRQVDARLPIFDIRTQVQQAEKSLGQERMFANLSSAMSLLALLLAAIGLYGTMSYAVARRTREIGIRMALGAQRTNVLSMVLGETMRLVFVGLAIGIPVAIAAAKATQAVLASLLFGVKPSDALTMTAAAAVLAAVALVAGFIPSWHASHVDPLVALRYE